MSNPIDTISTYINKYLWPQENSDIKTTDEKVQEANPFRKVERNEEPSWAKKTTPRSGCSE